MSSRVPIGAAEPAAANAAGFVRFDLLPEPLLRFIALALPADTRAIAACVCRASRAFLADSTLWQELDLTPGGGVAAASLTKKLARGAAKRAAGKLRVLSMNCMATVDHWTSTRLRWSSVWLKSLCATELNCSG